MYSKFIGCISRWMFVGTRSSRSYEQMPTQWSLTAHLGTVISAWPLVEHSISSFCFSLMLTVSKQTPVCKMIIWQVKNLEVQRRELIWLGHTGSSAKDSTTFMPMPTVSTTGLFSLCYTTWLGSDLQWRLCY